MALNSIPIWTDDTFSYVTGASGNPVGAHDSQPKYGSSSVVNKEGNVYAVAGWSDSASPPHSANRGNVRIYSGDGGTDYEQIGYLYPFSVNGSYIWYDALAMNDAGNIVAVASWHDNRCLVYQHAGGTTWNQMGSAIVGAGAVSVYHFGSSVDLNASGNLLAIGSPDYEDNGIKGGRVTVYSYSGGDWSRLGQNIDLTSSASDASGYFGYQVRIIDNGVGIDDDGPVLAVSQYGKDSFYIFRYYYGLHDGTYNPLTVTPAYSREWDVGMDTITDGYSGNNPSSDTLTRPTALALSDATSLDDYGNGAGAVLAVGGRKGGISYRQNPGAVRIWKNQGSGTPGYAGAAAFSGMWTESPHASAPNPSASYIPGTGITGYPALHLGEYSLSLSASGNVLLAGATVSVGGYYTTTGTLLADGLTSPFGYYVVYTNSAMASADPADWGSSHWVQQGGEAPGLGIGWSGYGEGPYAQFDASNLGTMGAGVWPIYTNNAYSSGPHYGFGRVRAGLNGRGDKMVVGTPHLAFAGPYDAATSEDRGFAALYSGNYTGTWEPIPAYFPYSGPISFSGLNSGSVYSFITGAGGTVSTAGGISLSSLFSSANSAGIDLSGSASYSAPHAMSEFYGMSEGAAGSCCIQLEDGSCIFLEDGTDLDLEVCP
tara:strand:- start:1089 stop:3053 length:1965 start_codon:yes stop_codon:yes gene_type:complete